MERRSTFECFCAPDRGKQNSPGLYPWEYVPKRNALKGRPTWGDRIRIIPKFVVQACRKSTLVRKVRCRLQLGRPFRVISWCIMAPGLKPWAILSSPFRRAHRALVTNASHRWIRVTVGLEGGWAKSPSAKARAVAAVWIAERLWKRALRALVNLVSLVTNSV
jgi:hypothetical protein